MSNKTELRARLRDELGDTGSTLTWSESLLNSLLDEAVQWYSRLFPMPATAFRDVAAGQQSFAVPPGAISVTQVECPPGTVLPREIGAPVAGTGRAGLRQSWSLPGGEVRLGKPASGAEIGAVHLVMSLLIPWDRLDPSDPWNGPEDGERLLVIWAAAEAWAWLEGQDQKRGRPQRPESMSRRYAEQLEREVTARKRAATSRSLQVD